MLLSKTKRTDLSLAEMHLTQTEPKQNNISFLSWSKILSKKRWWSYSDHWSSRTG